MDELRGFSSFPGRQLHRPGFLSAIYASQTNAKFDLCHVRRSKSLFPLSLKYLCLREEIGYGKLVFALLQVCVEDVKFCHSCFAAGRGGGGRCLLS